MLRGVLAGQAVQNELEVVRQSLVVLVQRNAETEQLDVIYAYLPVDERQQLHLCADSGGVEQRLGVLPVNVHIVDDNAVEQPEKHVPHLHLRVQFLGEDCRSLPCYSLLKGR